ncbi:MAG: hypothetical protein ABSB89_07920 [Candidatus Bathyarchaeia archaeon]
MKIMRGWRKMDRQRGFLNETTGQNLVVSKKEFSSTYVVLLFPPVRIDDKGETISPAYATASKAEAYALGWMEKHSKGTELTVVCHAGGGDRDE